MNTETKYILYAVGGIGAVMLIIFLVNRYRKAQAARRMMSPGMQSATGSNLENLPISIQMRITGTADWNNSTVKTNIVFGDETWAGDINPTTNRTETKNDQEIRITGGATNTTISLIKRGTVLKSANIDFYNEKLNGFN
jgi:hypothetical protein